MSPSHEDFDWPDISKANSDIEYTASDEEVFERMKEAAEETGMDIEEVYGKILSVLGLDEENTASSSLPEGIGSPFFQENPRAADDPRLEALDIYLMRQQI